MHLQWGCLECINQSIPVYIYCTWLAGRLPKRGGNFSCVTVHCNRHRTLQQTIFPSSPSTLPPPPLSRSRVRSRVNIHHCIVVSKIFFGIFRSSTTKSMVITTHIMIRSLTNSSLSINAAIKTLISCLNAGCAGKKSYRKIEILVLLS